MNVCDRINKSRKKGEFGRFEACAIKDKFAQVYDIHPNFNDFGIGLKLIATTALLSIAGYCTYRLINPLIEYFSR